MTRSRQVFLTSIATAVVCSYLSASTQAQGHTQSILSDVWAAIQPFSLPASAESAGYAPTLGCVSGPEEGAMGIHYVNGTFLTDGLVDLQHPEALIYEPHNGRFQLVGVEYIVLADQWNATHAAPPTLAGHLYNFIDSPNRYGLPAFYELHVWAGKQNPHGAFADWNPNVSCESYRASQ